MQQTSNYNMNKPAQTDVIDIDDLNTNFDTLDAELKKVSDKANLIQTAGGTATGITLNNVSLVNGFTITFIVAANNNGAATTISGKALYKPGGTTAPKLIAGKAVTVWYNGTNFFIKASAEGDAIAANVLAGKIFSNDDDTGLAGTMPNNGPSVAETINLTTGGAEYTIPAGYHSGLRKIKAVITNLIASVIKAGTTVGGVLGTFTADATALASHILAGKSAYVNGVKVSGSMPDRSGQWFGSLVTLVDGAGRILLKPPMGYYDAGESSYVTAVDPDFVPSNFLNTANVFGLQGTITKRVSDGNGYHNMVSHSHLAWGAPGRLHYPIYEGAYSDIVAGTGTPMGYIDDPDFVAANILSTANIFGLQGGIPILSPDWGAHKNATAASAGAYSEPGTNYAYLGVQDGGCLRGVLWIRSYQPDLVPANILNTANIFGMQGTAVAGKRYASGGPVLTGGHQAFDYGDRSYGSPAVYMDTITVSGLTFKPSMIVVRSSPFQNFLYTTVYTKNPAIPGMQTILAYSFDYYGAGGSSDIYKKWYQIYDNDHPYAWAGGDRKAYVNTSGFLLPIAATGSRYNCTWEAYE